MSTARTSEPALVLRLGPSGESHLKLDLLSPESGIFACLKRVPKKPGPKAAPDLFDTAVVELETARQGNARFVGDYHPSVRRGRIGGSYGRLRHASAFARLLLRNAAHMPDSATLFELAERTFDAFEAGRSPEIVLLKGLYLLLRDEGFPVRESWWPRVPSELKEAGRLLLNRPAPETASPPQLELAEALHEDLSRWVRRETELILAED